MYFVIKARQLNFVTLIFSYCMVFNLNSVNWVSFPFFIQKSLCLSLCSSGLIVATTLLFTSLAFLCSLLSTKNEYMLALLNKNRLYFFFLSSHIHKIHHVLGCHAIGDNFSLIFFKFFAFLKFKMPSQKNVLIRLKIKIICLTKNTF